eukprot:TRINITY_DN2286_c0_g1_i3.p1 TRINITY_DN2286_c0_g1~~TRINITY_DN2286_c0_g1_i3.p1  ORF type:complete len:261 (+),score=33.38 TRINITY_DN2286_c0_g1_i3:66-848(+)
MALSGKPPGPPTVLGTKEEDEELTLAWLPPVSYAMSGLLVVAVGIGHLLSAETEDHEDENEAVELVHRLIALRDSWVGSWIAASLGALLISVSGWGVQLLAQMMSRRTTINSGSYSIVLDKEGQTSVKLGLEVEHLGASFPVGKSGFEQWTLLPVASVSGDGLLRLWNIANPKQAVSPGDHIVEVNGVWGSAVKMSEKCRADKVLNIRLSRGKPSRFLLNSLRRLRDAEREESREYSGKYSGRGGDSSSVANMLQEFVQL